MGTQARKRRPRGLQDLCLIHAVQLSLFSFSLSEKWTEENKDDCPVFYFLMLSFYCNIFARYTLR